MMIGAVQRGLSLDMFDELNPGQIVDFCIEYNNYINPKQKDYVRDATQSDFNNF